MNDAMNDAVSPTPNVFRAPDSVWRHPWLYLTLAALGLAAWQWAETRAHLADAQQEVARRLADNAAAGQEERGLLKQAQDQVVSLQARVGALESRQAEFQSLYQDLARGRDEAILLEVEQAVNLAAQQLQLAGNVPVAVIALQAADAKLARLDRPRFLPLRKALARDLDRLRALPFVDLPGMSLKLEGALMAIDKLPLAMEERPYPPEVAAPASPDGPWWRRAGADFWMELRGLVRIQRFDRSEPLLLAPEQAFLLRENLKLRLLNARLALLSRDARIFNQEIKATQDGLARHFDGQNSGVQATQASLRQLGATEINIELPNLNDSLAALRGLKDNRERK